MEKIEFRYQWKKKWYYVDFSKNLHIQFGNYEKRNKTTQLEQFTDESDNENYQIFEGDIVEFTDYNRASEDEFMNKGRVYLHSDGINFSNRDTIDMEDIDWDSVSIIGNIWDTPELLSK